MVIMALSAPFTGQIQIAHSMNMANRSDFTVQVVLLSQALSRLFIPLPPM